MTNLGEYLASRYCAHTHEIFRQSQQGLGRKMFSIDSAEPNAFTAFRGYRVSFEDEGIYLRVMFNGQKTDVGDLKRKIGKLTVPSKYRDVLSSIKIGERDGKLYVDANFVPKENADGRSQNEDEIYFSIRNGVVKPVFKAIMEK